MNTPQYNVQNTPETEKIAQICPNLWVSGKKPACNLEMLKARNITVVVTMYDEPEMKTFVDYGIQYFMFPIRDNPDEKIDDKLWKVPRFIKEKIDQGQSVLVHCKEVVFGLSKGISRAPTMIIAYMMFLKRASFDQCYDAMKQMYPRAEPNVAFLGQLKELEKKIHDENPQF